MRIGFVGCSHLGICTAAAAAEKNFNITCFDFNKILIKNLNNNNLSFFEPGLKNLLKKNKNKINFTSKIQELNSCKLVSISQDTVTDKNNKSDFNSLKKLINRVTKILKKNISLVIMSQAYPGFTENINWDKKRLFYLVETLIFGKAIKRALKPEQIIIGSKKILKSKKFNKNYYLEKYVKKFTKNISHMHYKSAELAKISINLYLISSISFTNMLSDYCETANINWHDIEMILRNDKRVGKFAYLKPGLGVTSGNLLRDLNNAERFIDDKSFGKNLIKTWKKYSSIRKKWLFDLIKKKSKTKDVIGIFGLPYKENTVTLKNSVTLEILKKFNNKRFCVYDPLVKIDTSKKNFENLNSFQDLILKSNLLIFMTPWNFIKSTSNQKMLSQFKGQYIFDPFDIINDEIIKKNNLIKYSFGRGDFDI